MLLCCSGAGPEMPLDGIRALIFDFDGLILDTEWPEYQSWCEVYESHGHVLPLESWCRTVGAGKGYGFHPYACLEELTGCLADREAIRSIRRRRNAELILGQPLLDGVIHVLDQAEELGLRLGIASSSDSNWVESHLERFSLVERFGAIVCAGGDLPAKPHPAVYRTAVELLGEEPYQAIALEDSPNGIAAAQSAGLYCVAIPNKVTAAMDFSRADLVLSSLLDLNLASFC
jgi:HAD superfamily hydrolase (TIGR01509 family)